MQNAVDIFREFLESFPDKREKSIDMLHEDAVMTVPYQPEHFPNRFVGRAEIAPIFMMAPALYRNFRWLTLECYSTNDPTLCFALASSEAGLADGSRYKNSYAMVGRIVDGKVVEFIEFLDPREVTAAVVKEWVALKTAGG